MRERCDMAKRGSIYIQGQNSWLAFDDALTVTNETHNFGNEVVSQVLENGSLLTDHIIVLQDELEAQIFVSNSRPQESQDVYSAIKGLRNNRELCNVYTDHEIYTSMAIETVSAPHEAPQVNAITFTVKFKRVDWTDDVENSYPLAKYEIPLAPQLQSFSTNIPSDVYTAKRQARISRGMQAARDGVMMNINDVETAAVSMSDYGETTTLDNQRTPATSVLLDIITKISERNSYTQEEKETFFATHVGDVTVAGTGISSIISAFSNVRWDVMKYDVEDEQWKVEKTILEQEENDNIPLEAVFYEIAENGSFLPSLLTTPVRFNFIVSGQVLQVEMVYNELLHVWKGEIRDAIGQPVLENMTMMAGANCIEGLHLKYNRLNESANIVAEDLVLAGLYVTEPFGQERNVAEKGLESSQYAFTETEDGTSPCYVCYFESQTASNVYKQYMNGERVDQHQSYDELGDYVIG